MKLLTQTVIICFLLITPVNIFTYISSLNKDTMSSDIMSNVQTETKMSSHITELNLKFSDEPTFLIHPGESMIPSYTYHFTFPFGTNISSLKIVPKHFSLKQSTTMMNIVPYPSTSTYETLTEPLSVQNFNHPSADWYDVRMGTGINKNQRVLYVNIAIYPILILKNLDLFIIPDNISIVFDYEEPSETQNYLETYDMLLITIDEYKGLLQPFIEYKQNNTRIIMETVEHIPHQGRDIQENIKLFIKQSIEQWNIKSVLFVGGYNEIPVRNVFVQEVRSILMDDSTFISDLYYADIYDANGDFCSWDSNNNNVFGEFTFNHITPTDIVDLYPDVYFGRLACRTPEEVNISINKIITYEKVTSRESEWFNKAIAIGADTFTQDILGISEGEVITESIASDLSTFTLTRLYGSNGALQHAQDISSAIENGAGFVFFDGHAGSNSYRTHPSQSPSEWIPLEWYRTYNINALSNTNKYPIVTINACNTCKFSVNHTSFGWSFIINPNGGSIATVGMTCLSWIYPGIFCTSGLGGRIHKDFYTSYISGASTFGQIWAGSITQYLNENPWHLSAYDHKTLKGWQPFGDPSLQLPTYQSIT